MLQVELDHILTEDDALQKIQDIFSDVENNQQSYVVTKNGRPVFAIVDIAQLELGEKAAAPVLTQVPSNPLPPLEPFSPAPVTPAVESTPLPPLTVPATPPVSDTATTLWNEAPPVQPVAPIVPPVQTQAPVQAQAPLQAQPTPPVSEGLSPLPPLSNLPDLPEDPTNSSPIS